MRKTLRNHVNITRLIELHEREVDNFKRFKSFLSFHDAKINNVQFFATIIDQVFEFRKQQCEKYS